MRFDFEIKLHGADGTAVPGRMGCIACGYPANAGLSVEGAFQGSVCVECLNSVREGGIAGWREVLRRRIEKGRAGILNSERFADSLPDDATVFIREPVTPNGEDVP